MAQVVLLMFGDLNATGINWQISEDTVLHLETVFSAMNDDSVAFCNLLTAGGMRQINQFVNSLGNALDLVFIHQWKFHHL